MIIPFNTPLLLGSETIAVTDVLARGDLVAGSSAERCESWLIERTGSLRALMMPSCTHALELAALLADIGPGDEVIMPSYTFASTANAFVLRGAVPVFVDVRPDTCNLDERLIEAAITPRTRAIVPVHYAGVSCEMDVIMALADRYELLVIEDAAQGMMASFRGRQLGSIGHFGAYSFHATKNFTSGGEGGALLINDARFLERAEVMREKGTNRLAFLQGQVSRYSWQDMGSSYVLSEVQAACLVAQLQRADHVTESRQVLWERYAQAFTGLARAGVACLPVVPEGCRHNGHLFYLLTPSGAEREALIRGLASHGIDARSHYTPLHSSPAGRRFGRFHGEDINTTSIASRIVRLPLFYGLDEQAQLRVIDAVIALTSSG